MHLRSLKRHDRFVRLLRKLSDRARMRHVDASFADLLLRSVHVMSPSTIMIGIRYLRSKLARRQTLLARFSPDGRQGRGVA